MRAPDVLVFGFGALLHPSKVPPREPRWFACRAPDYAMAFQHDAGFGTLVPLREADSPHEPHVSRDCAHGVAYALRPHEVDELLRREKGYDLRPIRLVALDEQPTAEAASFAAASSTSSGDDASDERAQGVGCDAVAFISSAWHRLDRPVAPTRRYAELVLRGAQVREQPRVLKSSGGNA